MNYVEPIRDRDIIQEIMNYMKEKNIRNYILFMLGIYTGLRISDILLLRVRNVKRMKYISIREKKTGKQQLIEINPELRKALEQYCIDKEGKEFLIQSREGINSPLGRSQAYNIISKAAKQFGVSNVGCHTMRKTFGYHFYKQTNDIITLQYIFNHDHPSITLRYIGIKQDTANEAIMKFRI
jgi:integrase